MKTLNFYFWQKLKKIVNNVVGKLKSVFVIKTKQKLHQPFSEMSLKFTALISRKLA